jgi:spermidine synthase
LRHSRRAVEIEPRNAMANAQVGQLLFDRGDLAGAETYFLAALDANPTLGRPHHYLGFIREIQGRLDEALEHDRRAVAGLPWEVMAWKNLGHVLVLQKRWAEAADAYTHAVNLQPKAWLFRVDLAYALFNAHREEAARQQYGQALALNARWPKIFDDQAWALATNPDRRRRNGREAVELAEKACQATSERDPHLLRTLAAAYAEAGRFGDAVVTAKKALRVASRADAADIRRRLESYKQACKEKHKK